MNKKTSHLVNEAFALFGVKTFFELARAYTAVDQIYMKGQRWDAFDPSLMTNKAKSVLEQIDPVDLEEHDREWHQEILWFWYHHAISYAIWKAKDRHLAQTYADSALKLHSNTNRITKLLWFLVYDKVAEAREWMNTAPIDADEVEHANGLDLIIEYERGEFF